MIWLLLGWPVLWWLGRVERRRAAVELDAMTVARDELRSRIEHAAPVWRQEDNDFPGSRW